MTILSETQMLLKNKETKKNAAMRFAKKSSSNKIYNHDYNRNNFIFFINKIYSKVSPVS